MKTAFLLSLLGLSFGQLYGVFNDQCINDSYTGVCVACNPGYDYWAGVFCVKQIPNCDYYNKTFWYCMHCLSGHRNEGDQCVAYGPNDINEGEGQFRPSFPCQAPAGDFSGCSSCDDGQIITPVHSECKLAVANATAYNIAGEPTACEAGFFVGNGACRAIIENCVVYDQWNFNCLGCDTGFFYRYDACYPLIDNCDWYAWPDYLCGGCVWGFTLSDDKTSCS